MRIKKSDYIVLITAIIFILSFIEIKYFSIKSGPILLDYSRSKIINIISNIINESIKNKVYNYKYNDIIKVEKDDNGIINSIDFDNETVNSVLYIVSDEILDKIKLLEDNNYEEINIKYLSNKDKVYYIPYGIIYENSVISNLGPKIPFKVSLIGNTNNDTRINIEEYGINSSKIDVVLNVNIKMEVLLPFKSEVVNIDKSIILDSKIIQGQVPNYYGGMFSAH